MDEQKRADTEALLESLRWKADMIITNYEGERVWLKELFHEGKQIGITDCCAADEPCDYHASLQGAR